MLLSLVYYVYVIIIIINLLPRQLLSRAIHCNKEEKNLRLDLLCNFSVAFVWHIGHTYISNMWGKICISIMRNTSFNSIKELYIMYFIRRQIIHWKYRSYLNSNSKFSYIFCSNLFQLFRVINLKLKFYIVRIFCFFIRLFQT